MADCSQVMSLAEIAVLKDALCAQQKLLQKLYNELEAEREASATAASEALSVILRLQGEKAAVKMEAEQYKRLAEEKMCHAEESFAIIEDIITQKEMEMAALDYQVQTYKCELMSLGVVDPGDESLVGDANLHHLGRRNSAPLLVKYKKAMIEGDNFASSPEIDLISKNVEECTVLDSERKAESSTHGGITSYAEQIRELELRVKEIAGENYGSPSLSTRPSAGNLCSLSSSASIQHETRPPSPPLSFVDSSDPHKVAVASVSNQTKHPGDIPGKGEVFDYPCSSGVHDVFEVPQVDQDSRSYKSINKEKKKTVCESSEVLESKDHSEAVKPYAKDEPNWLKKLLHSAHNEKNLCKPSDISAIDRAVVQPTTSVSESQSSLNNINGSSEITGVERVEESPRREEGLKLLKEIKEKLNVLQDEIRCQKVKEPSMTDKPSLTPLSEAMVHFWL